MKKYLWPILILFSADVMVISVITNLQTPIRTFLAFWVLLVCPGMAFIRLFNFREKIVEWTLALALSMTIDTIVSEGLVLNHLWSPDTAIFIVAAFCIIGSVLQITQTLRQGKGSQAGI